MGIYHLCLFLFFLPADRHNRARRRHSTMCCTDQPDNVRENHHQSHGRTDGTSELPGQRVGRGGENISCKVTSACVRIFERCLCPIPDAVLLLQNFSEVAADFREVFSGEESPSLTQEHLNDPEFIKMWFQVKLMPLLPDVPVELLSCLSTKNFSCPVYHTLSVRSCPGQILVSSDCKTSSVSKSSLLLFIHV